MNARKVSVAASDELGDNQMKEVSVGETRILLVRTEGRYHALSATCTHYGAPLAEGVLHDGRIVCPWHHACFDAATGDLVEPPALDALACFGVTIEEGNIVVELPDDAPDRRPPAMSSRDVASSEVTAIIGGGAAGYAAAQTLREDGYRGRIIMITREDRLPYDRPNLSKDYLHGHADPEWMPLRPDEFYAGHDIEVMLETTVTAVDAATGMITFADGATLRYDSLLVATGGAPRRLDIDGADLGKIFYLRSFSDADAIIASAPKGARAVVIGASFIGMEAAFSLRKHGLEVTVVSPEPVPFAKTLGHEIGSLFQQIHEENGVHFRLGTSAVRFEGKTDVERVVLESGDRLEADLVIAGIGVTLETGFLKGVPRGDDGSITVDGHLRAMENVYAAGDIARFPAVGSAEPVRIEHWRTALQQGRVVAHNIAGRDETFDRVPFFWTQQFDHSLRYIGHAEKWDEIIWDGDTASRTFLAYYVHEERVVAVAGMKRDRDMAALEELVRVDRMPRPEELRHGALDLQRLLASARQIGG